MVEHSAVNRRVASSNLARGAKTFHPFAGPCRIWLMQISIGHVLLRFPTLSFWRRERKQINSFSSAIREEMALRTVAACLGPADIHSSIQARGGCLCKRRAGTAWIPMEARGHWTVSGGGVESRQREIAWLSASFGQVLHGACLRILCSASPRPRPFAGRIHSGSGRASASR